MMFTKSISIVLPVYNEEGNIHEVIQEIFNALPSITSDFEIIAVDDGSLDGTPGILKDSGSSDSRLKVIRHTKNKGYGAALISGFRHSEKELILMMDADRQFNISEITKLIPYINDFDIISGYRIKREDPLHRYFLGVYFNFITNIAFKIKTRDINCGFKLFKADLLRNMHLTIKGALINTEIMALAQRSKAKIKEVGVNHYPRVYGRQSGAGFKVIFKAIFETFYLWRRL